MSGLIDKAKQVANDKLNKDAQPGNKVEGSADNTANQKVNDVANDVGMPQQDQGMLDKVTDAKVNSDIPFGNK